MTYRNFLVDALKRSEMKRDLSHFGTKRMWDGCAIAYEIALEEYDKAFGGLPPNDPALIPQEAKMLRDDMEEMMKTLRLAEEELGRIRANVALRAWEWDDAKEGGE